MANAKALALALQEAGFRIVSGGTDNHLMLVDVFEKGILGSEAELALGKAGITVNKNAIPYDTNPPLKPSGIRVGTPALTTRGMKEPEMRQIAVWISKALEHRHDDGLLESIRGRSGGTGQPVSPVCLAEVAGGSQRIGTNFRVCIPAGSDSQAEVRPVIVTPMTLRVFPEPARALRIFPCRNLRLFPGLHPMSEQHGL